MIIVIALIAGTLLGAGIAVSPLNNPEALRDTFNIVAQWNPAPGLTLLLIALAWLPAAHLRKRTLVPWLGAAYPTPQPTLSLPCLCIGATLMGTAVALSGLLPATLIPMLALTGTPGLVTTDAATFHNLTWFFASFLAGLWLSQVSFPASSSAND